MNKKYKKIFEPLKIGNITVKNRIAMAPMTTIYAGHDGEMTEQLAQYYGARARGGTGMVIVEGTYINETGPQIPCSINVSGDNFTPGLSRLADAIKDNGAVAVLQLIHSGIQACVEQTVGPSPIGRMVGKPTLAKSTPRPLSTQEIEKYIQDFADAAFRAKSAGFDMVEVHGTHGYLIMEFLSPLTNRRNDKYGVYRDLFALEVVKAIKEKCGKDYPVIFRLCADESLGDELLKGGITIEDAKRTAKRLVEAGVDAFDVTGGNDDVIDLYVPPAYVLEDKEGCFIELAAQIKEVVDVPVISGGGIETPEKAEAILESGKVDMLFLGRQIIADPEWVKKVEEDRVEDIRPCCKCVECLERLLDFNQMRCSINPISDNEWKHISEDDISQSRNKKKVLIIGAGPAGMEAARIAALRGHDVTLVEKQSRLGGTLNVAAIPSFKYRQRKLIDWYEAQIKKQKINVVLDKEANVDYVKEVNPDVVILATGSEELIPSIPGIENAVTAEEALLGKKPIGENVIVIGCGLVGAEVTYYLAKQNKKVTIFEALEDTDLGLQGIALLKPNGLFDKYEVKVNFKTPIVEIYPDGVLTVDNIGRKIITKADTIISAVGRKPLFDDNFVNALEENGIPVKVIGDAKEARKVAHAVHEAFSVAMSI